MRGLSPWPIAHPLSVAVAAENWSVAIRLKRQFSNFTAATGAGPVSLVHLALAKGGVLIAHLMLFCLAWT